jgi:DNA-binding Lrp family transcriptional regulator
MFGVKLRRKSDKKPSLEGSRAWRRAGVRKLFDEEIIFLRRLGFNLREIANAHKICYSWLWKRHRRLVDEGYVEPLSRGAYKYPEWLIEGRKEYQRKKEKEFLRRVKEVLTEHGPMFQSELAEELGVTQSTLIRFVRRHSDVLDKVKFTTVPQGHQAKYRSYELFDGLAGGRPIIFLKGDRRIVDLLKDRVMKPKNQYQAKVLYYRLKHCLKDPVLAREVVEKAGYKYKSKERSR